MNVVTRAIMDVLLTRNYGANTSLFICRRHQIEKYGANLWCAEHLFINLHIFKKYLCKSYLASPCKSALLYFLPSEPLMVFIKYQY